MIAIKLISVNKKFENANYDVGHTYGINWKWNNLKHFHFYFNYHLMYFQLKKNSVGITEVSVVCMANDMYTSFNGLPHHIIKMAMNYIETILCASKLYVF